MLPRAGHLGARPQKAPTGETNCQKSYPLEQDFRASPKVNFNNKWCCLSRHGPRPFGKVAPGARGACPAAAGGGPGLSGMAAPGARGVSRRWPAAARARATGRQATPRLPLLHVSMSGSFGGRGAEAGDLLVKEPTNENVP